MCRLRALFVNSAFVIQRLVFSRLSQKYNAPPPSTNHASHVFLGVVNLSPPAVYGKNGGGNPPIFPFLLHFLSLFVHYFLENVTREPPITPKRGIEQDIML